MTEPHHAIVWIDHHQARVFHFSTDASERVVVHSTHPTRSVHHKANARGSGHAPEDQAFFREVVKAVGTAGAFLITGPACAKHEFVKHIERHDPTLMPRVAAVETLDHPTDGALLDHARRYFKAADLLHPQRL